jgi:hypothetical protein
MWASVRDLGRPEHLKHVPGQPGRETGNDTSSEERGNSLRRHGTATDRIHAKPSSAGYGATVHNTETPKSAPAIAA